MKTEELMKLKLEAFRLAASIAPRMYIETSNTFTNKTPAPKYDTTDLIKNAELIYTSLISI